MNAGTSEGGGKMQQDKPSFYRPFPDEDGGIVHGVPMDEGGDVTIFTNNKKRIKEQNRALRQELARMIERLDDKTRSAFQLDKIIDKSKGEKE